MEATQLRIVRPIVEAPPPVRGKNPVVTGPAAGAIGWARALTRGRAALVAAWDATPESSPCGRSRADRFEAATGTRAQEAERFRRWLAAMPRWRHKLFGSQRTLHWRDLPGRIRQGAVRRAAALRKARRAVARNNGGRCFRWRKDRVAALASHMRIIALAVCRYEALYDQHGTAGLVDTRSPRVHMMAGDPALDYLDGWACLGELDGRRERR